MATRRDRRAARAKPSAAALSRDLSAARARILGLEDRLTRANEKVFRQAGRIAAKKFKEKTTSLTASAPAPEAAMVAVYPTAEQQATLAQPGGEPAETIHVTLAFLGKVTPEERDRAVEAVREVAAAQPASPLEGHVVGVGNFHPSESSDGKYPAILHPDVPALHALRSAVCDALDAAGVDYSKDFATWVPHITTAYEEEALPPPRELIGEPLTFAAVSVARGDEPIHLPFGPAAMTAAADPPWVPPNADEIVDVDAIVAALHTKSDPIRQSAIKEYGSALEGVANWDTTNPLAAGVLAGAGQHVTSIAETTRLNVMRTISASYHEGLSIPDTAKAIQEGMNAASGARARLIARTELAAVANGGGLAATQIFADATGDTLYKRWLTAPGAEHPRHEDYEGLDGTTVGLDESFDVGGYQLQFPGDPDGPPEEVCNCFPAETLVEMPSLRGAMRRWYEGDLARVRLASGDELAATPNHPVLRADGRWVALGEIVEGDYLVSASLARDNVGTPDPDRPPAEIGQIYRLAKEVGATHRIRVRPQDLHRNGEDGEVDVVAVDGMLLDGREPASDEQVAQFGGTLASAARSRFGDLQYALRAKRRLRATGLLLTSGGVSRGGDIATLLGGHPLEAEAVGLRSRPDRETESEELACDRSSASPERLRDGEDAFPAFVTLTQVVEVERYPFAGHVYNLDTGVGWYTANSLVAANCRCDLIYVSDPHEVIEPQGAVDEELSSPADLAHAVPTAEAGIKASQSEEMLRRVFRDAAGTQAELQSGKLSDELTNDLKKVDTAVGGGVLENGAVTLRGLTDLKPIFREWPPKVGDIAYDPGYGPTTTNPRAAAKLAGKGPDSGFITYHAAPGQNGLWLPGVNPLLSKSELLLPRGLPLRVIGVGERDGKLDVHVEIPGRPVTPPAPDYSADGIAKVELLPSSGASPYAVSGVIVQNAARADAQITAALRHAIELRGGYMEGLPFRIKSAPSVARKIAGEMAEKEIPLSAAAHNIKDGLRFTAIFNPEDYVREMTATLDELKAKAGLVPERISATWKDGVAYAGTNVVMRAPNGLRFELQFHTPQSFDTKEHLNHGLYQIWRRIPDKTSPEAVRLAEEMQANADAVVRPPGIHEWKYEASVEADIGVTPFRAKADDPFGFYDSERYKAFEQHAAKIADSYGVTIDAKMKLPSVWEGVEEPGVSIHAHDGEKGVAAFAADLGKVYDQDGVLLFSPTIGDDGLSITFDRAGHVLDDEIFAMMKSAGIPGGRFLEDGRLNIIGSGPAFVAQADAVARDLGVGYDAALGKFSLLEKANGDYETALRDFASSEGKPVRPSAVALPEHGGHPALVPGAPGGKAGAEEVAGLARPPAAASAQTLDAAPLPHIPHYTATEIQNLSEPELWRALAVNGKIDNLARADVSAKESRRLRAELAKRGTREDAKGFIEPVKIDGASAQELEDAALAWPEDASDVALSLIQEAEEDPSIRVLTSRDSDGALGAIASTSRLVGNVNVLELASRGGRGEGTDLLRYIAREAASDHMGVQLAATNEAIPYYEKLGFKRISPEGGPAIYALTPNEAAAFGAQHRLAFTDLTGDNQLHTTFSDGHNSIREMALAAQKRGATTMVVSDHAHLMTSADIARQHRQIDKLNKDPQFAGKFKILKGIEANIDDNGYLDVAPEVLANFDVVNAAIHGTEGVGGQQVRVPHSPTERLLNVLNSPRLDVLVHPHAVTADWDAVAKKAAQAHVALEINGRSLLREDSAREAALMIAAAKKYGAKLAIGSDAHNAGDLIDLAYATRFAADHGVTLDDIAEKQLGTEITPMTGDPSASLPASIDVSHPGVSELSSGGAGGPVFRAQLDGQDVVVKIPELGNYYGEQFRRNITPGNDPGRERATYVMSRWFNSFDPAVHVNVPEYRIGQAIGEDGSTYEAAISKYAPGMVGLSISIPLEDVVPNDLASAGLFDSLVGNTDRHRGNYVVEGIKPGGFTPGREDTRLWLIDHGLTFPEDNFEGYYNDQLLRDSVSWAGEELEPEELTVLVKIQEHWDEISAELADVLDEASVEATKERLDWMIRNESRDTERIAAESPY